MSENSSDGDVLIIGAGLAGLSCAHRLKASGFSTIILEASNKVGGRVRTDNYDGYLLDRGFQVMQTAYPEARQVLDYPALKLNSFYPGALVWFSGRFHRVADPFRRPQHLLQTVFSPVGSLADKVKIARLRRRVCRGPLNEIFARPDRSTLDALKAEGFSDGMIDCFFRPFLGGVFLENKLETSSRMFEFVFRMFAAGDTALPCGGISAIPEQLASRLPNETVQFGSRVESLQNGQVLLSSGKKLHGRALVIATEMVEAARLLGDDSRIELRSTTCLYFSSAKPPIAEPVLVLNGEGAGPITSLCVLSQVAPSYAPPGKSLISVTVLGDPKQSNEQLEKEVRDQLKDWFDNSIDQWRHLRTYRIRQALPVQIPPLADPATRPVRIRRRLFICGEYGNSPSVHWAMVSGRRAAEAIIKELAG